MSPKPFIKVKCHTCGLHSIDWPNPEWLKWKRKKSGAKLREIARKAKVSAPYVCDCEYGRRKCNDKLLGVYKEL